MMVRHDGKARHLLALTRVPVMGMILLSSLLPVLPGLGGAFAESDAPKTGSHLFLVTTVADDGTGSLRHAIEMANARPGPDLIRFDGQEGPFATPQTIALTSPLPPLAGELTIDGTIPDRLWQPTGVTISGNGDHQVFRIEPKARVTIASLTVTRGRAPCGGGLLNQGHLVVTGAAFVQNEAGESGGAICNRGGTVQMINSTFAGNRAERAGGGLADLGGRATVTNCTFCDNAAPRGGGIYSSGHLLVRNTIVANSGGMVDCMAEGRFDPASTHNLIESNGGCGRPISTADPKLGVLGGYNGPTPTLPLGSGSPAINLGENTAAVDENGQALRWDQRGNGDPRVVAGITDIGAFEHQMLPFLTVDTAEDVDLRACTRAGRGDCSLRGAIALANAMGKGQTITFDSGVFSAVHTVMLERPLPVITTDLTLDGRGCKKVSIRGRAPVFRPQGKLPPTLYGVTVEEIN